MAIARKRVEHLEEVSVERKVRPVLKARPLPASVTVEEVHMRVMKNLEVTRQKLA